MIESRHSARVPFDATRAVTADELRQILIAARWAPTAHNMQNFEIVVVEDVALLARLGRIPMPPSETRAAIARTDTAEPEGAAIPSRVAISRVAI